jgi:hypothetical protein
MEKNIDNYFEIPEFCICPITGEMMVEPVMLISGHSYEKEAIQNWFERGNTKDPVKGINLPMRTLHPNYKLRDAIEYIRDLLPEYQKKAERHTNLTKAVKRMEERMRKRKEISELEIDSLITNHIKLLEQRDRELETLRKSLKPRPSDTKFLPLEDASEFLLSLKNNCKIGISTKCTNCIANIENYFECGICSSKLCVKCTSLYLAISHFTERSNINSTHKKNQDCSNEINLKNINKIEVTHSIFSNMFG